MTRSAVHSDVTDHARPAFTLLELMVVVAIIAVLVSLVLVAGSVVSRNGRISATKNVLITLDRALDEYITVTQAVPTYNPLAYEGVPGPDNQLVTGYDTVSPDGHPPRPDAAVFIRQTFGVGQVPSIIAGLPPRFLQQTVIDDEEDAEVAPAPSVLDAWASSGWPQTNNNPWPIAEQQVVYYVHPQNALAQDLYGRCVNGRPYFMSAGPDKKYGLTVEVDDNAADSEKVALAEPFIEDNIYSYEVGPFKRGMRAQFRKGEP